MRKIFILVGLGGLAYGLYNYYIKQLEVLNNYQFKVVGGNIVKASLTKIDIQLNVEVINNSSISIVLSDYFFYVFLNGVKVAVVKNASVNQTLEKNGGKSYFPMQISIATTQLLQGDSLLGLIESVKNSTYRLQGHVGVKMGILKIPNIPIDYSGKLKEYM